MHPQLAPSCLHHVPKLRCSPVFNDLSKRLLQRAFHKGAELSSAAQHEEKRGSADARRPHRKTTIVRDTRPAANIVIGDLAATLEAHRVSNRASIIRKIHRPPPIYQDWMRPLQSKPEDGRSHGQLVAGESAKTSSIQAAVDAEDSGKPKSSHVGVGISTSHVVPARGRRSPSQRRRSTARKILMQQKGIDFTDAGNVRMAKDDLLGGNLESLDYPGEYQHLQSSWKRDSRLPQSGSIEGIQRPWLAYMANSDREKSLDRFSSEIKAFEAYMSLTPAENEGSAIVVSDFTSTLRKSFHRDEIQLLGSRTTGLATSLSDFDFSVTPRKEKPSFVPRTMTGERVSRRKVREVLENVAALLGKSPYFDDVGIIHARIPLVRARHILTSLPLQVQTMVPFQAAQERTKTYITEMPSLRPLYVALRTCLEIRDLTSVHQGGVGSYTIFMMTVTALKHAKGAFEPEDLGGQLLHVLNFWGSADLYRHAYSVDPPRVVMKKLGKSKKEGRDKKYDEEEQEEEQKDGGITFRQALDTQFQGMEVMRKAYHSRPFLLCLQDPANPFNDLGVNSFMIKNIQATFASIHANMKMKAHDTSLPLKSKESIFSTMVGANFSFLKKRRSRIESCADRDQRSGLVVRRHQIIEDQSRPEGPAKQQASELLSKTQPPTFRRIQRTPLPLPKDPKALAQLSKITSSHSTTRQPNFKTIRPSERDLKIDQLLPVQ